jgi:hypothetical protein
MLSVPPTDRYGKSFTTAGVWPVSTAALTSDDHRTPASTSARPSPMWWMVPRDLASMAMPPSTSAWP